MWFPNFLSGVRIVVAVIFPFLSPVLRLPFVVLALLTEYFDGALARKYNWVTSVGQILDPVADKLFALSVGLTLVRATAMASIRSRESCRAKCMTPRPTRPAFHRANLARRGPCSNSTVAHASPGRMVRSR